MSNKETALEVFNSGIEAQAGRDTIIVDMVKAGVSLNSAQNYYKEFAAEAGISHAKVGHKKEAIAYLTETAPDIVDVESRGEVRAELQEKYGVAASTAGDYIKAYAEEAGIELPKSQFGANPEDAETILNWIIENPNCEKAQFAEFMKTEMGRSSGSIDETYRGIVLARKLQEAGVQFEG